MAFVCVDDYQELAFKSLPKGDLDYYRCADGKMITMRRNKEAYQNLRLRPKCLQNVSKITMNTEVLGCPMTMPVGIAPTALQKIAHPDGELATARAAERNGVIYIQSSVSSVTIEEVAKAAPNAVKWFQLYIFKDRKVSAHLVRRVEKCGFKAIVLTVDSPQYGISIATQKNKWDVPKGIIEANFEGPGGMIPEKDDFCGYDSSLSWDEGVKWLINFTSLPVIAKGILRAEDAIKAVEVGCKGVIVSNHGGRNLDTTPATIEVLPEIINAIGGRVPVMIDGGITQGTDVIKGLAFGASMVFLGRPILWGLTVRGEEGVNDILNIIRNDLEIKMKFCGTPSISSITKDIVADSTFYKRELMKYQGHSKKDSNTIVLKLKL